MFDLQIMLWLVQLNLITKPFVWPDLYPNPRGNDLYFHFITWRDPCTCGANTKAQWMIFCPDSNMFVEHSSRNERAMKENKTLRFRLEKKWNFWGIKKKTQQKNLILHFLGILGVRAWLLEEWVSMDWSLEGILASNRGFSSPFSFPSLLFYDCAIIYVYILLDFMNMWS